MSNSTQIRNIQRPIPAVVLIVLGLSLLAVDFWYWHRRDGFQWWQLLIPCFGIFLGISYLLFPSRLLKKARLVWEME